MTSPWVNCLPSKVKTRALFHWLFWALFVARASVLPITFTRAAESAPATVHIQVDASKPLGELKAFWRFFGADEPNYAYMKNGQKLLNELGSLAPSEVFFRAHNLLTSGDGTPALKWGSTGVYSEDAKGNPHYDWMILDRIFDTYGECKVLPYVEIGFMPKDLSIKPEPYQHHWNPVLGYNEIYTGWSYPPKDYRRWSELVFEWTQHCVQRYGRDAVEKWWFETWNEPNIGYWHGSPAEFQKLHDYAIDGVRRALPSARVGGPDTAGSGGRFTREFIEHCLRGTNFATGRIGTPLDFVSFHAKGAPIYTNGHVRMGLANQLRTVRDGFRIVSSFPELKGIPVVIGESDPEGCAACQGPQLAYRNSTMYSSYTAASFAYIRSLAQQFSVNLEGALTWAFEFEDQPYFAGFRSLASNGIDKPVFNVFRMFSKMKGQQVSAQSDSSLSLETALFEGAVNQADISALASLGQNTLCTLVWNYHDDDIEGPPAQIELHVRGLIPSIRQARLHHFRIDGDHSNAFALWKSLGSPQQPTADQYRQLELAGRLASVPGSDSIEPHDGSVSLNFALPRQAVSLLELTW